MTRFRTSLAATCLAAGTAALAAQQPVFRGSGDAVRVFVTVTDKDGRLVTTLTQSDFEVRDEGKVQPITIFDNTPQPIRLIVMLDVSGSMEGNLPLLRAAASELFPRLRPDDGVKVGTFGYEVTISPSFTRDVRDLEAALPRSIPPDAPTPLWRGLDEAMDALGPAGEQRRAIIVLTDGKDEDPPNFRRKPISQSEIIDRARREDVMIYGVAMRSRRSRPLPIGPNNLQAALVADLPDPGLAKVAEETGGGYLEIRPTQDLGEAFARVADELHSQYLLGYAPPVRNGKVHAVSVKTVKGNFKPRSRKTYVAPKS